MKRRFFVKSTGIAATIAALSPGFSNAANLNVKPAANEFYEIRVYELNSEKQQELVEEYLENAAIPAMNKYGIKKVGVFTELQPIGQTKIFVLIPYRSLSQFDEVERQLENDAGYQTRAASYLNAPADSPAYVRIQSSLLRAFKNMRTSLCRQKKIAFLNCVNIRAPASPPVKRKSKCSMTKVK